MICVDLLVRVTESQVVIVHSESVDAAVRCAALRCKVERLDNHRTRVWSTLAVSL